MHIFIKSCHASLEYDQARLFKDMGLDVAGQWDVGSKQRPKINGVTDVNSDINNYQNILLHQVEDFDLVMEELLKQGKKVILNAFGQGCDRQHKNVSAICQKYEYAFVSSYSVKDYNTYVSHGCPQNKIEIIRFAKYLSDFKPWAGKWPICYISCNSIHRRGEGCGFEKLQEIEQNGVPIILGGVETAANTTFGIGETEECGMRNIFSNAMCHLHLGTKPAPLTLSLLEAFCSGIPVIAYNNGSGLQEEGLDIDLCDDVNQLINNINKSLFDAQYRKTQHEKSIKNSKHFDSKLIAIKWQKLFERLK